MKIDDNTLDYASMTDEELLLLDLPRETQTPRFVREHVYRCPNFIGHPAFSGNYCVGFSYKYDMQNKTICGVIQVPSHTEMYWDYSKAYICPDCMLKAAEVIKQKRKKYDDFLTASGISI